MVEHAVELKGQPVVLANIEDRGGVRMLEHRRCLGLFQESGLVLAAAGRFSSKELERDHSMELCVLGPLDRTQLALAELLDDAIVRNGPAHHCPVRMRYRVDAPIRHPA